MDTYNVTGMSCAACSARVEKAVKKVPGVDSCAVSLLTNSMGVEGDADPAAVIAAVTKAGYGASLKRAAAGSTAAGSEAAAAGGRPMAAPTAGSTASPSSDNSQFSILNSPPPPIPWRTQRPRSSGAGCSGPWASCWC